MKKSKNIVLIVTPVLSAALLNACSGSQPRPLVNASPAASPAASPLPASSVAPQTAQTRDVYNSLNDCIKDWGEKELCEQMGEDDDRDYRTRYRTSGSGRYFYGPRYSSTNRIITYKGKTLTPTGKTTKMPSYVSTVPSKTTSSTTSSSTTSSVPSTTSKSTTSSTVPSTTSKSTTSSSSTSSTSSTSTYNPSSSYSSTSRGGFGTTSSYSSSSSSGS